MTKAERVSFMRQLARNVLREAISKAGDMPDNWDGMELRAFLADRFDASRGTVRNQYPHGRSYMKDRKRTAAYKNAMLELYL